MSELSDLDVVSDIFPTYPRSDLAARLLCSQSVEVLIEELILEQQSRPEKYDVQVYLLKDMFPNEPLDVLAALLQRQNGDILKCIDALAKPDLAHRLTEITGISLLKLREKIREVEQSMENSTVKEAKLAMENRILLVAMTNTILETSRSVWDSKSITNDGLSKEEQELKLHVLAEPLLRVLNYTFLRRSLVFFKYDVFKVLEVASMLTEAGLQSLTFELDKPKKELITVTTEYDCQLWPAKARQKPSGKLSTSPPKAYSANQIVSIPRGNTLDLHGFTVAQAMSLVESTALAWWKEEQEMRTNHGKLDTMGAQVQFVDFLIIITGRGLHSTSGPKIRKSVVRWLTKLAFLFEEDVGRVIVKGKKKRM